MRGIGLLGLGVLWMWGQPPTTWKPAPLPANAHKIWVAAHRGDHTQAPENTLESLQNAIKAGADYVEVDVRRTRDGQMVVMHDATVDRMTDGKGRVSEMTLEEFRSLHIVDRRFPNRAPEPPPTFEAFLKAMRGKIGLYLDAKDVDPAEGYALLKRYKMDRKTIVYCGGDSYKMWKQAAPKLPVMVSPPDEIKTPEALIAFWRECRVEVLDGDAPNYTPEMVAAVQKLGAVVFPDIQNPGENPKQWDQFLALGVRGLQSDHPAALIAYLKSRGLR